MNGEMGQEPGGPQGPQPTAEELQAAFEEQMRNIRVEDVLLQTAVTLVNLAARRLGLAAAPGEDPSAGRDLEQAKTAIEGVRALLPLCPADQGEPIRQALTQIQMAFSQAVEASGRPSSDEVAPEEGAQSSSAPPSEPQAAPGSQAAADEEERRKTRSKIWTPPGA